MIELYDRGCTQLKNNPEELLYLALVWLVDSADGQSMREFVEEVVDEEEAVDELDLPLSQNASSALKVLGVLKSRYD